MIEIRPMDEEYLHIVCLHGGPVDTATWKPSWDIDPSGLPPHPWSDETIRELAATCNWMSHGGCEHPAGRAFLREMIQRYGTCALLAWEGRTVVGHIRFYPMKIARLIVASQPDSCPVLDCTAACEPDEDDGTLWVQCVMTCAPYQDAEGAREAGARKGTGLQLARALVPWAREHGWKRIVKVAHADLDCFYGILGGGGKAFWEKSGFSLVGTIDKWPNPPADFLALVQAEMAEKGMTDQEVWRWYRMAYQL